MANIALALLQHSFGAISKVSDCSGVVTVGDGVDTPVDSDAVDASVRRDDGGEGGCTWLDKKEDASLITDYNVHIMSLICLEIYLVLLIYLPIHQSIYLSIYPSINLYLSVFLSIISIYFSRTQYWLFQESS